MQWAEDNFIQFALSLQLYVGSGDELKSPGHLVTSKHFY